MSWESVRKDKKQAKRTEEEKEEGRRQKHSSRKQGRENKTDQTKSNSAENRRQKSRRKTQGDSSNYTTAPFLREWRGLENGTAAGEQVGHRTRWTSIPPLPAFGPCWLWCPGFGTFDNLGLVERNVHMAVAETQRFRLDLCQFAPHHVCCYGSGLKGLIWHAISVRACTKIGWLIWH